MVQIARRCVVYILKRSFGEERQSQASAIKYCGLCCYVPYWLSCWSAPSSCWSARVNDSSNCEQVFQVVSKLVPVSDFQASG